MGDSSTNWREMRSGKVLALTFFARLLCFQFDRLIFLEFLDKQDFYFLR